MANATMLASAHCIMNEIAWLWKTTREEAVMEPDPNARGRNRETILTLMLMALLAGALFFFLIVLSGGLLVFLAAAVFAIALVGLLHYVLWGYTLSQEVAGDREEEEVRMREAPENDRGEFWERPWHY
jgi:hypothetical protein